MLNYSQALTTFSAESFYIYYSYLKTKCMHIVQLIIRFLHYLESYMERDDVERFVFSTLMPQKKKKKKSDFNFPANMSKDLFLHFQDFPNVPLVVQ